MGTGWRVRRLRTGVVPSVDGRLARSAVSIHAHHPNDRRRSISANSACMVAFQSTPITKMAGDAAINSDNYVTNVFQSTPTTKMAGDLSGRAGQGWGVGFQSTPTTKMAGDPRAAGRRRTPESFNPRPPPKWQATVQRGHDGCCGYSFNPRPPPKWQATRADRARRHRPDVSIHAHHQNGRRPARTAPGRGPASRFNPRPPPKWQATSDAGRTELLNMWFQSTPTTKMAGDTLPQMLPASPPSFNPRPPPKWQATRRSAIPQGPAPVSIHAHHQNGRRHDGRFW